MSKKVLNKKNLAALGADTLADLLLEVVKGHAALQRRVRMELSATVGAEEVVRDIRKRFASLRRSTARVSWRGRRALAKELTDLQEVITTRIAPENSSEAFELLWEFLHLAPSIHERTDDSSGTITSVMAQGVQALANLAPQLDVPPATLAETVFEAMQGNGYGEFDGVIPALAVALGPQGLDCLKALATAAEAAPLTEADLAHYRYVTDTARRNQMARDRRNLTAGFILKQIADLQGDVDAYMARYSAEQLTFHTIAPDVASRLLAADRAPEALQIVEGARARAATRAWLTVTPELDAAYIACLKAVGQGDVASRFLWEGFCQNLGVEGLRAYLKDLPDFDDIEAEDKAKAVAQAHPSLSAALAFFIDWPDLRAAARLIETRHAELDGNEYDLLNTAAGALEADHPLAAALALRAMIEDTLRKARAKRYGFAARHLAQCATLDMMIDSYGPHPGHEAFVEGLRQSHPRKPAFWRKGA